MRLANKLASFVAQGRVCSGKPGESLLKVLRSHSFEVPSLCHHPRLSSYAACRLCLVEIAKGKRRILTTSCNYPVQEGIEVFLDSERVVRHRRIMFELLLSMAPNAAAVRDLARAHGVTESRFETRPGSELQGSSAWTVELRQPRRPKAEAAPVVSRADNCILCGLCTRVCREGARAEAIALVARGERRGLGTRPFSEFPPECIGCGACAHVCPTGAISMEEIAVSRMRDRWGEERPCRYALMRLLPGTVCENDYRCARCEVDQRMVDLAQGEHPVFLAQRNCGVEEGQP